MPRTVSSSSTRDSGARSPRTPSTDVASASSEESAERENKGLTAGSGAGARSGPRVVSGSGSGADLRSGTKSGSDLRSGASAGSGAGSPRQFRSQGERVARFVDPRELKAPATVQESLARSAQSGEGIFAPAPKVIDIRERMAEKAQMHRRRILVRVAVICAIIAAVVLVVWTLFFSPLCRVSADNVTVTGTNRWVTTQKVEKLVKDEIDVSLLLVSSGNISEKITALPATESVSVSKSFPNSVHIEVSVRKPQAILRDGLGTLSVVDKTGVVMAKVSKQFSGVPLIEVDDADEELTGQAVKQALAVLAEVPDSMLATLTRVTAMTQDSVTTTTKDGHTIVWGNASDMKLKVVVVQQLLDSPKILQGKKSIDVSAPKRPIIK